MKNRLPALPPAALDVETVQLPLGALASPGFAVLDHVNHLAYASASGPACRAIRESIAAGTRPAWDESGAAHLYRLIAYYHNKEIRHV